jgi:PiT family inorganic phosphate transporter
MEFPILLIVIIALALIFDYINGFHDAANSIATIVSTKVLTPFQAVLWAALWNFAAFFIAAYIIGEFKIGNTIAKTVNENFITLEVIFSGLVAAIAWNLLTWWFGIPSSSSHTDRRIFRSSFNARFYDGLPQRCSSTAGIGNLGNRKGSRFAGNTPERCEI